MEKYLITGFSGFVSKYFLEYLDGLENASTVLGLDLNPPDFKLDHFNHIHCEFHEIDLLDQDRVSKVIFDFQPTRVLHLASYSSVAFSWKNPVTSFSNNTNIFLTLLEAIRDVGLKCRILSIGSSEEYGNVLPSELPLTEESPMRPLSPYAVARVSQEMLSRVYVDGYGMDIVMTRSFNHIGPGQRDIFVISSFARQLVEIKKKNPNSVLTTGNLAIIRDFLDVRDVVRAYYLLLENGKKGQLYNVCSGTGVSLQEIVQTMMKILGLQVETFADPERIRPSDNPVIVGSNQKLKSATGWEIGYGLDSSLTDIIDYWNSNT